MSSKYSLENQLSLNSFPRGAAHATVPILCFFPQVTCCLTWVFSWCMSDALRHVLMIGILIRPVGGFESVTSAMTFNAALIVFPVLGIFNPQIFSVNESPLNDSVSINAQESIWQPFSTVALLALIVFIMC